PYDELLRTEAPVRGRQQSEEDRLGRAVAVDVHGLQGREAEQLWIHAGTRRERAVVERIELSRAIALASQRPNSIVDLHQAAGQFVLRPVLELLLRLRIAHDREPAERSEAVADVHEGGSVPVSVEQRCIVEAVSVRVVEDVASAAGRR